MIDRGATEFEFARLPAHHCGEIHIIGFNRRKMEAQRAAAAEKEAAAKRATEDAGRLVAALE